MFYLLNGKTYIVWWYLVEPELTGRRAIWGFGDMEREEEVSWKRGWHIPMLRDRKEFRSFKEQKENNLYNVSNIASSIIQRL